MTWRGNREGIVNLVEGAIKVYQGSHKLEKYLEYTGLSWKVLENTICPEKYLKNTQGPWKVLEFYHLQEDSTVFLET